MEIASIPGIREVPAAQPRSNGFDLPAVLAVPDPARSGDDTYNGKQAATGGQDDDDEGETLDEVAEELGADSLSDGDSGADAPMGRSGPVDCFA